MRTLELLYWATIDGCRRNADEMRFSCSWLVADTVNCISLMGRGCASQQDINVVLRQGLVEMRLLQSEFETRLP